MNGFDNMKKRCAEVALAIGMMAVVLLVSGCIHAQIGNG